MLAVVTLPHGQITTLSDEATLSRGLSHHRITLVARLGRALVAEHQAESSFRVQQLLMWLRVAARVPTTMPHLTACWALEFRMGFPIPTLHPPCHPLQALPCSRYRTQAECCRWRVAECPFHALWLPNCYTG